MIATITVGNITLIIIRANMLLPLGVSYLSFIIKMSFDSIVFQYLIQFATFYWLQIGLLLQIGIGNTQNPSVGVKNGKCELDGPYPYD